MCPGARASRLGLLLFDSDFLDSPRQTRKAQSRDWRSMRTGLEPGHEPQRHAPR